MAIRIDGFEKLTFEIPAGKGKWVEISVPPIDCFSPDDVEKMNAELAVLREVDASVRERLVEAYEAARATDPLDEEALAKATTDLSIYDQRAGRNPNANPVELHRFFLAYFNPTKAKRDAIEALVPRMVSEIAKVWEKESGITPGEFEDSTESSSETQE